MALQETYQEALACMPSPGGGGCHTHIMRCANLGALIGLGADEIFGDIRRSVPPGGRHVPDREIEDAIRKALRETTGSTPDARQFGSAHRFACQRPEPEVDGDTLFERITEGIDGDEITVEGELWEASPIRLMDEAEHDAVLLLRTLYEPDDMLFLGSTYDKTVKPAGEWIGHIEKCGMTGLPHIIPNTLDGQEHETGSGTMSRRCDAAVKDHRFVVVEFDERPRLEQLRFWLGWIVQGIEPRPAALIDSGGKSVHGWLVVACRDRIAWKTRIRALKNLLTSCGADRATFNPARLSRLPGHLRIDKGRLQRLLYLAAGRDLPRGPHGTSVPPAEPQPPADPLVNHGREWQP